MATTERLPLKHDAVPARKAAAAPKRQGGSMWPWYLLLLLLIGAVGAGAWWLSNGKDAAAPELPAERSLPIPVTEGTSGVPGNAPEPTEDNSQAAATATPTSAGPLQRSAVNSRRNSGLITRPSQGAPRETERAIFTADEAGGAPPADLEPAAVANPRPYAGRVVQLGAFPSRDQAEDSWKRITRRYPYLLTKSKMVNTVYVEGHGGGRPTRMYRLQLGTSSQAQSVVICQQLERAGHSCVVVY